MEVPSGTLSDIADEIARALQQPTAIGRGLARLLEVTHARAVGYWSLEQTGPEPVLILRGFAAVPDMEPEVQAGFQAATRCVPLTQLGLGIVQAVVHGRPAVPVRAPNTPPDPTTSPGWLVRFKAQQSLAMPIFVDGEIRGALAVAAARLLPTDDPAWPLLQRLTGCVPAQ